MIRAWVWDNFTTRQTQGLLSQFASVLVLVEMEVTIFYLTPAGLPLAVHKHVQVTCKQAQVIRSYFTPHGVGVNQKSFLCTGSKSVLSSPQKATGNDEEQKHEDEWS